MGQPAKRICPVSLSGSLDNKLRRWVQNPVRMLAPYIREGMVVLDFGCGPGFFTLDMARMVGASGRVIATDVQPGMLERLKPKIENSDLADRIVLHRCAPDSIGLLEPVDFVLAFYVIHEIPDKGRFFTDVASCLKPRGQVLVAEPPIHVSASAFRQGIAAAHDAGFSSAPGPRIFLSKSRVLKKTG